MDPISYPDADELWVPGLQGDELVAFPLSTLPDNCECCGDFVDGVAFHEQSQQRICGVCWDEQDD